MESCAMRNIATTAGRPDSALHNGSFWNPRKRSAAICRIRKSRSIGLNTRPQLRRSPHPPPNSKPVKNLTGLPPGTSWGNERLNRYQLPHTVGFHVIASAACDELEALHDQVIVGQ